MLLEEVNEQKVTDVVPFTNGFVDQIEREMRDVIASGIAPEIEIVPVHRFVKKPESGIGIYAREITIPEGAVVTGKLHKTDHLNILSKGTISVWHDNGDMRTISAPYTFISKAGARRFAISHTECVWTTIHGTNETDLDKLEEELVVTLDSLPSINNQPCLS